MSSHDFDEEDTKPFLIFNRASVDRWLCCFRILSKSFTFGLEIAIFSWESCTYGRFKLCPQHRKSSKACLSSNSVTAPSQPAETLVATEPTQETISSQPSDSPQPVPNVTCCFSIHLSAATVLIVDLHLCLMTATPKRTLLLQCQSLTMMKLSIQALMKSLRLCKVACAKSVG